MSFSVRKTLLRFSLTRVKTSPNSGVRWWMIGIAPAAETSGGIGVGPGDIKRYLFIMFRMVPLVPRTTVSSYSSNYLPRWLHFGTGDLQTVAFSLVARNSRILTPLAERLTFGHHGSQSRRAGRRADVGQSGARATGRTRVRCIGRFTGIGEGQRRRGGGTACAGLPDRLFSRHATLFGGVRATPVRAAGANLGSGVAALVRACVVHFLRGLRCPVRRFSGTNARQDAPRDNGDPGRRRRDTGYGPSGFAGADISIRGHDRGRLRNAGLAEAPAARRYGREHAGGPQEKRLAEPA